MIVGYGTSHDCGIAVIEKATGEPVFAASLERLSRHKNQDGSPLALINWLPDTVLKSFAGWRVFPVWRDEIYPADKGFHALERTGDLLYRWTDAQATLSFDSPERLSRIYLQIVSEKEAQRRLEADILVNGQVIRRIHNGRPFWFVSNPFAEPVREVTIRPVHVFSCPPDTRTLGILVRMIAVRGESPVPEADLHAVSDIPAEQDLFRLLHKQFVHLPRLGLRGHKPRRLAGLLRDHAQVMLSGARTHSELLMNSELVRAAARYDHHACHAASAYYPSGFDSALIVSLDGMGNNYSCKILRGDDGVLKDLKAYYYEEVPAGLDYELVTAMLGFNPLRHAGKITGLAAFGKDNPACEAALAAFFDEIWKRLSAGRSNSHALNYDDYLRSGPSGIQALLQVRQDRFRQFTREDLAWAIQKRTEQQVCDLVRFWKDKNPDLQNIALAGGVFGNVKLNQRIKEMGFRGIFVQPAMSDAGLCFGAAILEAVRRNGGRLKPYRLRDVFLGVGFSNDEIRAEIDKQGLQAEFVEEDKIAPLIARFIAERKVVAHFHGRMEFGPRALGNRSILYSAADPDVNKWLNDQLNRTEFMPFAPAVAYESAGEYFKNVEGAEHSAEFMTITFDCTEKALREIPAAIHVDNTARPQLVHKERNPRFYNILKAYEAITGTPVTINTSFNMHEEPIVATPYDAIRCYQLGHLDVLVLGNYIIRNTDAK